MKEIPLTQGFVALVDDEDFEYLNQWKWTSNKGKTTCYAQRKLKIKNERGNFIKVKMHREVLGLHPNTKLDKTQVDHKDHNGLNNQKDNLRKATPKQNSYNCTARGGASKHKGVTLRRGTWIARIGVDYKRIYLGTYKTEADAALAYNRAALKHFGEFAFLNII